jgi:Glucodextranase, domain B
MRKIVITLVFSIVLLSAGCKTSASGTSPAVVTGTTSTTISSFTSTTSVGTSIFTGSPPLNAPVPIDATSDGQTVNVNLVKYTGTIPNSTSRVLVNDNPVSVDAAGNYSVYLDLQKGRNIIEIKTITGLAISNQDINVFFTPPLTVRVSLTQTSFDPDTVFKTPSPITGVVSDPEAVVEVNGAVVKVNSDGSFTSQIQQQLGSNQIEATARSNNDMDQEDLYWHLADNGQMMIVSGFVTTPVLLPTVTLNAGESAGFNFTLQFDKTIPAGAVSQITITRIDALNDLRSDAMLPGLNVTIDPLSYTIYPRIIYNSHLTVTASTTLAPGDYYFYLNSPLGQGALFQQTAYNTSYILNQGPNSSQGAEFEVIVN